MSARDKTAKNASPTASAREAMKLYRALRDPSEHRPRSRRTRRGSRPLEGQVDIFGNEATVEDDRAYAWRDKVHPAWTEGDGSTEASA